MKLLLRWVFLALSVLGASYLCQALGLGFEAKASNSAEFIQLMIGAAILALLNATLGNFLKLLTLPLSCLTLGIFSLIINAVVLIFAASFDFGFRFSSTGSSRFLAAFVASLLIAAFSGLLNGTLAKDEDREENR